ncbi:MAG: xanthine dehydrogenase family protein molybdopterin-binding subunit [Chloroflexi bacterium]|nr:xanthine dehydrogenase family protein molybdopterin-binding subunit [Chloroflexota bacterium]
MMTSTVVPSIGEPVVRIDGWVKASGAHIYPSDFVVEGMLWLRVLRAHQPHARILSIDTSAAEQVDGVVGVFTAQDVPGSNRVGTVFQDMPVLCEDKVRYVGDAVAIVAAESDEAAYRARDLIRVEYEPLPVVSDPRAAMEPDAPRVHDDGNLVNELHFGRGDLAAAFERADFVFENEYRTSRQAHAFLETEAGVAFYGEDGRLTVRVGGQSPQGDQTQIARALGLRNEDVRVIMPMPGGAFGGKYEITVQGYLALVTLLTKRPCRIMLDRDESFLAGIKRHPFHMRYRTACTAEGQLVAAEVELIADTGAYASVGPAVLSLATEHCLGPYYFPTLKIDSYCVYTNNSFAGAFRGFGAPQVVVGIEQQMDIMARAVGMDPIEFRRRNGLRAGQPAALGNVLDVESSLDQVLEAAESGPIYSQREELVQTGDRWKRRGVGVAATWQGFGFGAGIPDYAVAQVALDEGGHYQLLVGSVDLGQGNATAFVQIAAHELGCRVGDIELVMGDTLLGPDSGPSVASRSIAVVGSATANAARDLRQKILEAAADELQISPDRLALIGDAVVVEDGDRSLGVAGLGPLLGQGNARMPEAEEIAPGIPHKMFGYGAQVTLVEVDLLTGEVDVLKVHSVIDAGKAINRQGVEAQSEGGIAQGLGYALSEDTLVEDGQILNPRMSTYIIPSISDVPVEIETTILEYPGPAGSYGAKGIGEIVLTPTAAAVLNGVYDATGRRFTRIPLLPERVLGRLSDAD